jgi:DNA-binding CsgD family transcriptional regulator
MEVLRALADGLSDREMSESLYVGVGTVRNHLVSIFGKLGVNSRLQALVFALRHGIVEIDQTPRRRQKLTYSKPKQISQKRTGPPDRGRIVSS